MAPSFTYATLALSLVLASSGCVARAIAIGGADGQRLLRAEGRPGDLPVYDCHPNWFNRGSVCTPRPVPPAPRSPQLGPAQPAPTYMARDGTLWLETPIDGGTLRVVGKPARHPGHALLSVRPRARLGPAPCTARLFRDGASVSIVEHARKSEHELWVVLAVNDLHALERSVRFAGTACGFSFVLDEVSRTALATFEMRFREELAHGDPSP